MLLHVMVDIAVDIAAGIGVGIVADIAAGIEVAVAGASLAVLPFVDKAEPFACKVRLDRVFLKSLARNPFFFLCHRW